MTESNTLPTTTFQGHHKQKSTSSGDRTHDHKIKSLALYHLSYGGIIVNTPTRDRTGDLLRVKQTS